MTVNIQQLRNAAALNRQGALDIPVTTIMPYANEVDTLLRALSKHPGLVDILVERERQVQEEGWTPDHDRQHSKGELARAAAGYCLMSLCPPLKGWTQLIEHIWPWGMKWLKPGATQSDLYKAGALISAEQDRLGL